MLPAEEEEEEYAVNALEENRRSMLARSDSQEDCNVKECNGSPVIDAGDVVCQETSLVEGGLKQDATAPECNDTTCTRENEILRKQNNMNGFSILSLL